MSRSYRKSPICGLTGAESVKDYKRECNQRERAKVRQMLYRECHYEDDYYSTRQLIPWNEWASPRAGKLHLEEKNPGWHFSRIEWSKYRAKLLRK